MKRIHRDTALRVAGILSLVGLAFLLWPVLAPTPFALLAGMSGGETLCGLGVLVFAVIVLLDLRKAHVLDVEEETAPKT